jgi:hypothetical protein
MVHTQRKKVVRSSSLHSAVLRTGVFGKQLAHLGGCRVTGFP